MEDLLILSEILVEIQTGSQSKTYIIPYTYQKPGPISEIITFARKNIFKTMLSGHCKILEVQYTVPYYLKRRKARQQNRNTIKEGEALSNLEGFQDYDGGVSPFFFLND
jgi:hypothetical protein